MKYALLINHSPVYHSNRNPIKNADGTITVTADEGRLREAGFLPVVRTPKPDDGHNYIHSWRVIAGMITEQWEVDDA